jgi:hypothetical protein
MLTSVFGSLLVLWFIACSISWFMLVPSIWFFRSIAWFLLVPSVWILLFSQVPSVWFMLASVFGSLLVLWCFACSISWFMLVPNVWFFRSIVWFIACSIFWFMLVLLAVSKCFVLLGILLSILLGILLVPFPGSCLFQISGPFVPLFGSYLFQVFGSCFFSKCSVLCLFHCLALSFQVFGSCLLPCLAPCLFSKCSVHVWIFSCSNLVFNNIFGWFLFLFLFTIWFLFDCIVHFGWFIILFLFKISCGLFCSESSCCSICKQMVFSGCGFDHQWFSSSRNSLS